MNIITKILEVPFYSISNTFKRYQKAFIVYFNCLYKGKLDFYDILYFIEFFLIELKYYILKFRNEEKYNKEINIPIFNALAMNEKINEKSNEKIEEIMYLDLIMEFLSLVKISVFTAEEIILLLKNKYPDFKDKIDKILKLIDYVEK